MTGMLAKGRRRAAVTSRISSQSAEAIDARARSGTNSCGGDQAGSAAHRRGGGERVLPGRSQALTSARASVAIGHALVLAAAFTMRR